MKSAPAKPSAAQGGNGGIGFLRSPVRHAGSWSAPTAGGIHRAYLYGRLGGQALAKYLKDGGPHPGEVVRRGYPRRPWQLAARWAYDHLPAGAMLEAALRMPLVFRRVAGKIFFDRMSWPE